MPREERQGRLVVAALGERLAPEGIDGALAADGELEGLGEAHGQRVALDQGQELVIGVGVAREAGSATEPQPGGVEAVEAEGDDRRDGDAEDVGRAVPEAARIAPPVERLGDLTVPGPAVAIARLARHSMKSGAKASPTASKATTPPIKPSSSVEKLAARGTRSSADAGRDPQTEIRLAATTREVRTIRG